MMKCGTHHPHVQGDRCQPAADGITHEFGGLAKHASYTQSAEKKRLQSLFRSCGQGNRLVVEFSH